jgi:Flp pilus assembly protein TadG
MLLARFIRDRTGGVAPLLALAIIPIMGAVAASVDYSRASAIRSAMQSSLDATALMLSKTAQGLNSTQLQDKATEFFTAVFNHPEAAVGAVTPNLTQPSSGNFALTVSGTATVNTLFAKILGLSSIDLTASSQVLWGIKKLNLALVLDMDCRQPQHLERLRDGPGPEQRRTQHRAGCRQHLDHVPGKSGRGVPGRNDSPVFRLDRAKQQSRRDDADR